MEYSLHRQFGTHASSFARILFLASLALVTFAPSAAGQDLRPILDEAGTRWVTIEQVELGEIDLDTSRFVLLAPDIYQVRTRWRFASVQTAPGGYQYRTSVAVRAIDCRKRQAALIAFADHDEGDLVHSEAQPVYAARWDEVNPESIVDLITTRVCDENRRDDTRMSSVGG